MSQRNRRGDPGTRGRPGCRCARSGPTGAGRRGGVPCCAGRGPSARRPLLPAGVATDVLPPRVFGPLSIDVASRQVFVDEEPIALTRTEFDILSALSSRLGVVWSRTQLIDTVWGEPWVGNDHLVDVHVGHVRRKLGDDPTNPRFIYTVRGVGYRMGTGAASASSGFGMRRRLLLAQTLVLLAGGVTIWVVASVVGPPLFREHLHRAGIAHDSKTSSTPSRLTSMPPRCPLRSRSRWPP